MGRREVTTTTTRAVRTCDRCDRDLGGISPNHCWVCRRELGYCCSRLQVLHPKTPGVIELMAYVCLDCLAVAGVGGIDLVDEMRAAVLACEERVAALLADWRTRSQGAGHLKAGAP